MPVKLAGAALLLGAGFGLGWEMAARLGRRVRELRSLGLCLRVLEKEVAVGAVALPVALERAARVADPAVGRLLAAAAGLLTDGRGRTASEAWEEALSRARLCLLPQDLEVVRGLGVTLGSSGRADQVRHISLAREQLAAREQAAREDEQRQGRLYRYLGGLGAAALLLLLW